MDPAVYDESDMAVCNMPCPGNVDQMCGGKDTVNIYKYPPPAPTGAISHGCYTDDEADRVLERVFVDDSMTTEVRGAQG